MSRSRSTVLTLGFLLLLLAPPAPASATPPQVAINTLKPELEEAKGGAGSKIKLEFTNIADQAANLEVTAPGQAGCTPTLNSGFLKPNQVTPVEVEIPADTCNTDVGALKLKIEAESVGKALKEFIVEPQGSLPGKPEWNALLLFPILLLIGLVVAAIFLRRRRYRLGRQLRGVDSTWKFNDNWATNVTAAGALLTGLFGATTTKAFLGEEAESLTALATVGAAIAVALVAAAPIVVLATKSYAPYKEKVDDKEKPGDFFTVGGILLAAVVIVAAAVGQLAIIAWTALELEISNVAKIAIGSAFVAGAVFITVYAYRSLKILVDRGLKAQPKEPGAELEAALVISKELKALRTAIASASAGGDEEEAMRRLNWSEPKAPGGEKEEVPEVTLRPRRSALI